MASNYDTQCGVWSLGELLTIPTSPPLKYILQPDDIQIQEEDAGVSITIKYDRFTRPISAVQIKYSVKLYAVPAAEVLTLTNFARTELEQKVFTTGLGSITMTRAGEVIPNCYIVPPIGKGPSLYKNNLTYSPLVPPEESFDTVDLTIVSPTARWF